MSGPSVDVPVYLDHAATTALRDYVLEKGRGVIFAAELGDSGVSDRIIRQGLGQYIFIIVGVRSGTADASDIEGLKLLQ